MTDIPVDTPLGKTVEEIVLRVTGSSVADIHDDWLFMEIHDRGTTILALCKALREAHERLNQEAKDAKACQEEVVANFTRQAARIATLEAVLRLVDQNVRSGGIASRTIHGGSFVAWSITGSTIDEVRKVLQSP